jgi:hypothetical protein
MTNQERIDRGHHAKRLLGDELLAEAFDTIEMDIFNEWRDSNLNDYDQRTDLFLTLKCLERLKAQLRAILDDGTIASRS